jgi:hypothetical protein
MTPSLFECRAPEAHETLGGLCVTGALTVSEGETKRLKAGKHCERAQFRPQLLFKKKNNKQPALTGESPAKMSKSSLEMDRDGSFPAIFDC